MQVDIWTTFAANGNPNISKMNQKWNPVTEANNAVLKCMNVDVDITFIDLPESKSVAIWDELEKET